MKKTTALILTFLCLVSVLSSCSSSTPKNRTENDLTEKSQSDKWVLTYEKQEYSDGDLSYERYYEYDESGKLVAETEKSGYSTSVFSDFIYDNDERIIFKTETFFNDTNRENKVNYTYTYDNFGNCISLEEKGDVQTNYIYTYDKKGNVIKEEWETAWGKYSTVHNLMYKNNQVVQSEITYTDETKGEVINCQLKQFTYDDNGNRVSEFHYFEEENNSDTKTLLQVNGKDYWLSGTTHYTWKKLGDVAVDTVLITDISTSLQMVETSSPKRLSEDCDIILASGENSNGDYYELVANESKSYDGKSEVGVIKNNEWLVGLTSESPFIDKSGAIMNYYNKDNYIFCCESCFAYGYSGQYGILWNAETNTLLDGPKYSDGDAVKILGFESEIVNSKGRLIDFKIENHTKHFCHYDGTKLIDTNTMEITFLDSELFDYPAQFSEGLFYSKNYDDTQRGFYDENFNLVIDLSKYNITTKYSNMFFKDGICNFWTRNSSGTAFLITIDKNGNVISELREDMV